MKKRILLGFIVLSIITLCYASGGYNPHPPITYPLVNDRIRNTPAVDPDEYGYGIRFYITTFGIDNYSGINRAPKPKAGELVRFGIENSDENIQFHHVIYEKMSEPQFNEQNTINPNCYNEDDSTGIMAFYDNDLLYTDGITRPEGYIRYESGSGFWASPILIKRNGVKTLIILTKSGCLMSLNVDNEVSVVNWKMDLRESERDHAESYKFEFMATPLVIGDALYIAGIKHLHIVSDLFSANPIHNDIPFQSLDNDDYFEFPIVEGTNPDNSLYAISRKGKAFKINSTIIDNIPLEADCSSTPPFVDVDGHVYFTSINDWDIDLSYVDQDNRVLEFNNNIPQQITLNNTDELFKSCILSDFSKNKYLFTDMDIVRISEGYEYSSYSIESDPLLYSQDQTEWAYRYRVTSGATRFPGNHSILAYHNSTLQTMVYTIANHNSAGYSTDYLGYYPNHPNGSDLYNLAARSIQMSYFCYQSRFGNNSHYIYDDPIHRVTGHQTWGGVAPYVSLTQYYNSIFGDENGCVTTYTNHIESETVNFLPILESISAIIPDMGCSKFMQNQTNQPLKNEVEACEIYLWGCDFPDGDLTYINSFARQSQCIDYQSLGFNLLRTQIDHILPNKEYQITFRDGETTQNLITYERVEIDQNSNRILLMVEQDAEINGVTAWDFTALNLLGLVPHFRNVTIGANAHLSIINSQVIIDNLFIGINSHLTLQDNAHLNVGVMECKSPNGTAVIDLSGTQEGRLTVLRNFDNTSVNDIGSNVVFNGNNLTFPNYVIRTFLNKPECTVSFLSYNQVNPVQQASVSIVDFQNKGTVNINDCVSLEWQFRNYDPGDTGIVNITTSNQNYGHLIWNIPDGYLASQVNIGNPQVTDQQKARLTINGTTCLMRSYQGLSPTTYHVWGTVSILGSGVLNVTGNSTLQFEAGSLLELNGGNDTDSHGAQLLVDWNSEYGTGKVKFDTLGVDISGYKPRYQSIHGDIIVTDEFGSVEGNGQNPRKLKNINIISTHPNELRWEGIYINTNNTMNYDFELETTNQSIISGIDKIYVKDPGEAPAFNDVDFINCSYGVFSTIVNPDPGAPPPSARNVGISDCNFKDCSYGIYLENLTTTNPPPSLSASITNCEFGNNDALSGFNFAGVALRRAVNVSVNDCDFFRNGYGIISLQSSVLVGGSYATTYPYLPTQGQPCHFYNNEKAGIDFEQSSSTQSKSLIYRNEFSSDFSTPTCTSGIGIWANESIVDVIDNDFNNLGWHGMLMKSYNWNSNTDYHGFAANTFQNNNGCELIGDAASLSTSRNGLNLFDDDFYTETHYIPNDPLANFDSWDKYILANLSSGLVIPVANMRGNSFAQTPPSNRERFYPNYNAFRFDPFFPTSLTDIIVAGMNQFYQGLFDESIQSMKQAVEVYPDSLLTKLAIDYLYLATRASSEDYSNLRAYLDLKIPTETLATYVKKEEIKTKCYIKEEDYLTAISRLQLILDNPETVADSLFALIDQAYCYMNMANEDDKSLPNISVKTTDFTSYLEFLAGLSSIMATESQNNQYTPQVLNIESNYPNPFNPETTIRFSVPSEGMVNVTIYNIKGQRVNQLLNEHVVAGRHAVMWNGMDSSGRTVSSGLYFAKIQQGNKYRIHKMMLMK